MDLDISVNINSIVDAKVLGVYTNTKATETK